VDLHADDAAAAGVRDESRGPAEPRAHVEDARARPNARAPGEGGDGVDAAVMVLVEREEVGGGEARARTPPRGGGADVRLVDRMAVVEVDRTCSLP
jgi:hypothetical protein